METRELSRFLEKIPERKRIGQVRSRQPVIHCITNYVTAGYVADMVLAVGGSPVMADNVREVEDIARISHGLVLNLGTMKEQAIEAMALAGKKTAGLGHPVVLDPVGIGASGFRREAAVRLLAQIPFSVIRGNASEIRILAGVLGGTEAASQGIDSGRWADLTRENFQETVGMLQGLSKATGAVVVMTGAVDMVADSLRACQVKNGHFMMSRITGSGCMLDGVIAAFLAGTEWAPNRKPEGAQKGSQKQQAESLFWNTVYGVAAEGICGELAYERTIKAGGGTGTFRTGLLDAMSLLTDQQVYERIRVEICQKR